MLLILLSIIERKDWEAVQLELDRREEFRQRHDIHTTGSSKDDRFYSRVFCSACGGNFIRKNWAGNCAAYWKCENTEKKKNHTCNAKNVKEETLRSGMVIAWNSIVENRERHLAEWNRVATEGNALERYRARVMIAISAEGTIEAEIPELTRAVLEEIVVNSPTEFTICFLDRTKKNVRV